MIEINVAVKIGVDALLINGYVLQLFVNQNKKKMKQKAEKIYHRFVNYEWNDVGEGLKKSILKAIETALKEGQKLSIHNVGKCACDNVDDIKPYYDIDDDIFRCDKCDKQFC